MYNVLYMCMDSTYIFTCTCIALFLCANTLVVWLYELLTFNFILVMCTHPFLSPALRMSQSGRKPPSKCDVHVPHHVYLMEPYGLALCWREWK